MNLWIESTASKSINLAGRHERLLFANPHVIPPHIRNISVYIIDSILADTSEPGAI